MPTGKSNDLRRLGCCCSCQFKQLLQCHPQPPHEGGDGNVLVVPNVSCTMLNSTVPLAGCLMLLCHDIDHKQQQQLLQLHHSDQTRSAGCQGAAGVTLKMFFALMFSMHPKHTLCLQGTKAIVAGTSSLQIWHSSSPSCMPLEACADSFNAASPWPHTEAVMAVLMAEKSRAAAVTRRSCPRPSGLQHLALDNRNHTGPLRCFLAASSKPVALGRQNGGGTVDLCV